MNRQLHRLEPGGQSPVPTELHFDAKNDQDVAVVIMTASQAILLSKTAAPHLGLPLRMGAPEVGAPCDLLVLLAGKGRLVERYWPPTLKRPWRRRIERTLTLQAHRSR